MVFSKDYARRCGRCHPKRRWELPRDEEIGQVTFRSALFVRPYPNFPLGRRTCDGLK